MAENAISKEKVDKIGEGSIVLSVDATRRSPSVIIKNNGVTIMPSNASVGIVIDDSGVSLQGNLRLSASGKNIVKGIYNENPKSAKPYTYTETLQMVATGMETAYDQLAKLVGSEMALKMTQQGMGMLMTDIASGPLPHMHTISQKHVHGIEPAYLYRMSPIISSLKNIVKDFMSFLK